MSQPALKPKRDDTLLTGWESIPDRAPSIVRADRLSLFRGLALVGLFLFVLGSLAMWREGAIVSPAMGFACATIGVYLLFLHAFAETDQQFRRLYSLLALVMVAGGMVVRFIPESEVAAGRFLRLGAPLIALGGVLIVAVLRHESDAMWRKLLRGVLGVVAVVAIAGGVIGGLFRLDYLAGEGSVVLLLGLLYASCYIGTSESTSDSGYHAALALGGAGLVAGGAALFRSLTPESTFFVPGGLALMTFAFVAVGIALCVVVDWPIVLIARRELASYFYSPLAYLVFGALLILDVCVFAYFVATIQAAGGAFEPAVQQFLANIFVLIANLIVVPALTMSLLAEERRTGTLEVMFTAPVTDSSVAIGKFLAAWVFYLLLWTPWIVFLVALRYMGGSPFEYRAALSFGLAFACSGAGLIALGLFFSSITGHQFIAAVLTFVAMMGHLVAFFAGMYLKDRGGAGALADILSYINFFDLWFEASGGTVAPRFLVFHLSVAAFFLFLTTRVLQSRRWL